MRFKNKITGNEFDITEPSVLKLVKNDKDFEQIGEESAQGNTSKQNKPDGDEGGKTLAARSAAELKAMAKEAKIPGYSGMSKESLIAALEKAAETTDEGEGEPEGEVTGGGGAEGGGSADGSE